MMTTAGYIKMRECNDVKIRRRFNKIKCDKNLLKRRFNIFLRRLFFMVYNLQGLS